jgi:hypothetical protein
MNIVIKYSTVGLVITTAFTAGIAVSQRDAPTDNRGVKGELLVDRNRGLG